MTRVLQRFALPCLIAALHAGAFAGAGDTNTIATRDPMQAPSAPAATRPDVGAFDAAASESKDAAVRHLMVIDGRRYVIEGGQRLSVGDRLGDARIERIDDGAVWLRDARGVRQVSLFGGIVKRPSLDDEPAQAAASTAARANTRTAKRNPKASATTAAAPASNARTPQALASVPALQPDQSGSHPTR